MSVYKKGCLMVAAIFLGLTLGACGKEGGEGPAERAGKEVDKAMEKAGEAVEKATESVKEAAKDAADKVEGMAKDK